MRQLINPKDQLITISLLGIIPKVDCDKILTKLLLFYNFGMKLKSAHLILILDHAPTPTTPSKQIPTFSINNLLGGKADGSETMSGPRFLSWKMSTSRKTHMEPPKLMHWKPFF